MVANVIDCSYRFDPSRWAIPTKGMKDAFMPFGAGSRSKCESRYLGATNPDCDRLHWNALGSDRAAFSYSPLFPPISELGGIHQRRDER